MYKPLLIIVSNHPKPTEVTGLLIKRNIPSVENSYSRNLFSYRRMSSENAAHSLMALASKGHMSINTNHLTLYVLNNFQETWKNIYIFYHFAAPKGRA